LSVSTASTGQRVDDVLEEGGGRGAGLVDLNPDDGLAAEVVDGRELEVMPGVTECRQVFQIDVDQLARATLFVPPTMRSRGTGELTKPVLLEHALDRAVTDVEQMCNPHRTIPTRAQRENLSRDCCREFRRGAVRPPTDRLQRGEIARLVPCPPAAEYLASDLKLRAQCREWNALLMQRHELGSEHGIMSHPTHASPPATHLMGETYVLGSHRYAVGSSLVHRLCSRFRTGDRGLGTED